ncbi:MAG: hypothetical protein O3C43_13940 [Verrucomicrobia bacterium]|nr:hypothetical protein [Verrucomicrobiota bacterium]MDA1067592.1 hypothetical protein [Verrucomicrobiota bacterium]
MSAFIVHVSQFTKIGDHRKSRFSAFDNGLNKLITLFRLRVIHGFAEMHNEKLRLG